MERSQFQLLVGNAIEVALQQENITLSLKEKNYLGRMIAVYSETQRQFGTDQLQDMDRLWDYFKLRAEAIVAEAKQGPYNGPFDPGRLLEIVAAIGKHWFEIRQCGELYEREISMSLGRENKS